MVDIINSVKRRRASENTMHYVLYGYYFLGFNRAKLSLIYGNHKTTISNWNQTYERCGTLERKQHDAVARKFNYEQRIWLADLYRQQPLLYLNEARAAFEEHFRIGISASSVCRILHSEGLTWKSLERRAIQIRQDDIYRFCFELNNLKWHYLNLLFLDEVSFDNRGMLRTRGYAVKGQEGMLECSYTEGTFTRKIFFQHCRQFAVRSKHIETYPGYHSIWILDGARIHCDDKIVGYFHSLGIFLMFLPAYTPFYNPIEIVFGIAKKKMQQFYKGNSTQDPKTLPRQPQVV